MQKVVQQVIGTVVVLLLLGGCTGAPAAPPAPSSSSNAIPSAAPTGLADDTATRVPATPATPGGNGADLEATMYAAIPTPDASSATPTLPAESHVIDVGGYELVMECTGEGSPTVVLEHGMAQDRHTWASVQPGVAAFTRVCSYTRARAGQGPQPRTSQQIVKELHTLVAKAGIAGPYVLVGQGFGGYNVRLYTDTYPDEVVGLVLVDAFHEDVWERSRAVLPPKAPDEDAGLAQLRTEVENPNPNDNPEGIDWEASAAQVRAAGSLGDLPLVVLSRGRPVVLRDVPADVVARLEEVWRELQQDLPRLSTNSTHIIAEESNHFIQEHQPELIVDAIRQVVEASREHEGDGR